MEILICTDGSNSSILSADLVAKFGFPAITRMVILAVSENKADIERLTSSTEMIEQTISHYTILEKLGRRRHGCCLQGPEPQA